MNLLEPDTNIKCLLKEKNITQEKLVNMVQTSRTALSKLGNGTIAQVSIVPLNDILNHLGYALDIRAMNPLKDRAE